MDRCPLYTVDWDWPTPDGEKEPQPPRVCNEPLHLVWTLDLYLEDMVDEITVAQSGDWANTSCWEVVCEGGHTLARSTEEENAEPFLASRNLIHPCTSDQSAKRASE